MTDTVKSWIDERQAALAHVLKHPHPDPAAEWAQTALDALNKVLELHKRDEFGDCETCIDGIENCIQYPCPTVQAIEGAIND